MALGPTAQLGLGLASFIPGLSRLACWGTGGSDSVRYCYSVWLRHLVLAGEQGLDTAPRVVAELGPGDSLGIGLAALLSGSEQYWAFDVLEHADVSRNIAIFDSMVELFRTRAPIPDNGEFPKVKPILASYAFPHDILTDQRLEASLSPDRVERIREHLGSSEKRGPIIRYCVPWDQAETIEPESVDLIFSQAVLEHVDDLERAYAAMASWLKPGGYVSHQIDFTCHGTASEWNGYWRYSDLRWRLIRGRRPYLINRQPYSEHMRLLRDAGLQVMNEQRAISESLIEHAELASRFRHLSEDDLRVSGVFVQARKLPAVTA